MGGFVPTVDRPPLQELVRGPDPDYGWRVLVVCVLLNRAGRAQAERAREALLRRWPTPVDLAAASLWRIEDEVRCCGFQRRRAQTLALLSVLWARDRSLYAAGARSVRCLPGIGRYGEEAFWIFALGHTDFEPEDSVLAEWVRISPRRTTRDATYFLSVGKTRTEIGPREKGSAMSATAEQIKPKDLEVGAYVRIDGLEGEVSKNDKKGGRLTIADNEGGHAVVKYRDVVEVEIVGSDDGVDEAKADLEAAGINPGAMPTFPTPAQLQAERKAAEERKKTTRSPKAGTGRKYPEEITDAVRRAKAARGTTNGAPGAKQHVYAREVLARRLGRQPASWASLLEASDPANDRTDKTAEKILRDLASGKAPKDKLKVLHPLAQTMTDPFCKGRNLASILVAWGEQLQVQTDVDAVKAAK